jgi:hypothetical protein
MCCSISVNSGISIPKNDKEFKKADKIDNDNQGELIKYTPSEIVHNICLYYSCVFALWSQRVKNCIYQLKRAFKVVNDDDLYENSPVDILCAIRDERVFHFGYCDYCQRVTYLREYEIGETPFCLQCWEVKIESEQSVNGEDDVEMEDDLEDEIIWI